MLYVGELPQIVAAIPGTPAYTEAGFRVGWRITPQSTSRSSVVNVLHDAHIEFISPTSSRSRGSSARSSRGSPLLSDGPSLRLHGGVAPVHAAGDAGGAAAPARI
jgi:hypothetical protein